VAATSPLIPSDPISPASESPATPGTETGTETETGQTDTTGETEPGFVEIAGPCCLGTPLAAGVYASPSWFEVPFGLSLGNGWSGVAGANRKLLLLGKGKTDQDQFQRYVAFFAVDAPRRFVKALRSTPGLLLGEPEASRLGGRPADVFGARSDGVRIEIPAVADLGPGRWSTKSANATLAFVLVGTGATSFLVYVEAPRDRFGQFSDTVRDMLRTVAFAADA
jgi:hypothetical protein